MTPDTATSPSTTTVFADTVRARHTLVIVGAGFGGLTMAAELKTAGIDDFAILESGHDLGGVWRENTYPGCTCDVPSHLYSFAFDPHRSTEVRYPDQAAILTYMQDVAERHGLRSHLHTGVQIATAEYDDTTGTWTLTTTGGQHILAEYVVWAVGQLHRPAIADLRGLATFGGHAFHSARWDHSADLTGHIAVIGTGSSAAQIVPHLARTAARVTVYQRTAAWILPRPRERFGPISRAALRSVPGLHRIYRHGIYRAADLVLAPIMRGGWSARPAEWIARAHLRRHVSDPWLRSRLTPDYRIGEKRILLDNNFYPALTLPHVELVTDEIDHVSADGIHTTDGTFRQAQVIVLGTGFTASQFLGGITVRGRDGADLHAQWQQAGRSEAYFGLAVPNFPNMFLIAGPNSFTAANSNPAIKASQARYIMRALALGTRLRTPIEVSASAMVDYRRWLHDALADTVWSTGVPSWFKQPDGAVTNPWPGSASAFERMTAHARPEHDFVTVPSAAPHLLATARRTA
ncbi:NAD(P)/FAD-dependent oxidoreductase (plasmid) [Nocardia sp. NBC_01377]|uniref:flavin-containing monooxygenase n=1 Tax=Nocardia sp. NBC_01377 TaxID=2903595 RepID=UPI002F919CBC